MRVVDPWDRPVEYAWVTASSIGDRPRRVAQSGGRGDRIFLLLPPGQPVRIEASSDSPFGEGALEPVLAEQGEVKLVLLVKGARVSGRVVCAETGAPIPRVVLAYSDDSVERMHYVSYRATPGSVYVVPTYGEAVPDSENGEFDLLVPPATTRILAGAEGREPAVLHLSIREGEWLGGLEFALAAERKSSLRVRVVDEEGVPIRDARVDLLALPKPDPDLGPPAGLEEVAADSQGGFRFESAVGEHWLLVSAPGFESAGPARASLSEGENEVEVVLARAARLRVRGVLPDGSATSGGQILLERSGRLVGCATSNGPVGSWTLHGRAAGARFEGARIAERAHPRTEEGSLPLLLDAEGFLALEGIAWGKYGVTVVADSFEGRGEVVVPPGETASVEVRLAERK